MDKDYKSFQKNMSTKDSFSMAKRMALEFSNWSTEISMMDSGLTASKMVEESILMLQPEFFIAENGKKVKKMDRVI